jgi:hypothetical protein
MPLPRSSIVRLFSEQYREQGVEPDTIGVVVEIDGDATYDIDFSEAGDSGEPKVITVPQIDVELMAKPGQLRTDPPVG